MRWLPIWPEEFRYPESFYLARIGWLPLGAAAYSAAAIGLIALLVISPFGQYLLQDNIKLSSQILDFIATLMFGSMLAFLGAPFFFAGRRLFGVEGAARARNFLANGAGKPWGEALRLARLAAEEYDRALFVEAIAREASGLIFWAAGCVALGATQLAYQNLQAHAWDAAPGWSVAMEWAAEVAILGAIAALAVIEVTLIGALQMGLDWRAAARARLNPPRTSRADAAVELISSIALIHFPGLCMVALGGACLVASGARPEAHPALMMLTMLGAVAIFVAASAPVMLWAARGMLRRNEGAVGALFLAGERHPSDGGARRPNG